MFFLGFIIGLFVSKDSSPVNIVPIDNLQGFIQGGNQQQLVANFLNQQIAFSKQKDKI